MLLKKAKQKKFFRKINIYYRYVVYRYGGDDGTVNWICQTCPQRAYFCSHHISLCIVFNRHAIHSKYADRIFLYYPFNHAIKEITDNR